MWISYSLYGLQPGTHLTQNPPPVRKALENKDKTKAFNYPSMTNLEEIDHAILTLTVIYNLHKDNPLHVFFSYNICHY